jgi:hypothetical protein
MWRLFGEYFAYCRPFIHQTIDMQMRDGLQENRVYLPTMQGKVAVDAIVKPKTRDKHERFRELAEARTNKAIEAILRIGNLSNRQIYEFEDAEVSKIIRALKSAITSVEGRFDSPRSKGGGGFKL